MGDTLILFEISDSKTGGNSNSCPKRFNGKSEKQNNIANNTLNLILLSPI